MHFDAYLSNDRVYRYWLLRVWDDSLPIMANWGANPSTADETENDPTIRKDMGFAARTGHGGLLKLNVGAFRATRPADWYKAADPFGPDNTIADFQRYCGMFNVKTLVAAWGNCIGKFSYRGEQIIQAFPEMMCFGKTLGRQPWHTLMLPYSTRLVKFKEQ